MTSIRLLVACAFVAFAGLTHAHGPGAASGEGAAASAARPAAAPGTLPPTASAKAEARGLTMSLLDVSAQFASLPPAARQRLIVRIVALAMRRHDLLEAFIASDPEEILRIALPPGLRASLPPEALPFVEEYVDEDGEIEVLHVDHVDAADDYYIRTLKTAAGPVALHFAGDAPDIETGKHVRVRGVRVGDAIALTAADVSVEKAVAVLSGTLGTQKTLVILVNFSDKATQPFTVATATSTVFGTTSNYDLEASYQQTTLTGDVAGWYTIANPSTNCDYNAIASQAKQKAAAAGYVLSNYRRYVYAFPPNTCTWWGLGSVGGNPSQAWVNTKWGFTLPVIGHEMGHNFGLYHSHSLDCGAASVASSGCTSSEYGDIFDMMGSTSTTPHFNAYQKERLGWLNAGLSPPLTTVPTIAGTRTYTIAPIEDARSATSRALKIPRGTACAATGEWFYVESRQAKGFHAYLAGNANVTGGVLVRKVTEGNADSSFLLDMTPATTAWNDAALVAGQAFTDPLSGVVIMPVSVGTTGATVNVTLIVAPVVPTDTGMIVTPDSGSVNACPATSAASAHAVVAGVMSSR